MTGWTAAAAFSPEELERLAQAVEERFGLYFPANRQVELERGLRQAFAASSCRDLGAYLALLQDAQAGALEMDRLVNAVTVGETYFFRDAGQFDALYAEILPQLVARRRPVRTLRIWSAGCASGEEPYSLAMMLRELLPDVDEWAITILGTDVNGEALHRARGAVYGEWAFREERARQWRPRYFRPEGNRWALVPQVRRMVTFQRLNLAAGGYPAYENNTRLMDLILCRNVTIYFADGTTRRVVERLHESLADGGWLVVGHAEPAPGIYDRFRPHILANAVLYQKTGRPAPQQVPASRPAPRQAPASRPAQEASIAESDPVERAREMIEWGQAEEARALLLQAATERPRTAEAHALLGQACANLGHWQEAERWCRRAIDLDRLSLEAYYTLGLVMQHQDKLEEALEAMKKVVYIDRHSILGHFGLATLHHSRGQGLQALKALENARRLLDARPAEEVIPRSGGITAARLLETVVRQQQQWQANAVPAPARV